MYILAQDIAHFRAVFGKMIQFLSKGKRIDGSGKNGQVTVHLATLHLAQSFSDIEDDEAR